MLCKIPNEEEIKSTFWTIHNLKSLGPDGMTYGFYKNHWSTMKLEVVQFLEELFITKVMNKEINETMIILLQKRNQPSNIHYYRHLSLCNVSYKTIPKSW